MPPDYHFNFKVCGKTFLDLEKLLFFVETLSKESSDFLRKWFDNEHFISVKTSGTTGIPKTILLPKAKMIHSAKNTIAFFDLPPKTKAFLCLSPNFIAGKMMWVRAMVGGWDLKVVSPDNHPLKNIKKQYDFAAMVPSQLKNSLENLHKIKKIIVGGAAVPQNLQKKLQNLPTKIYATYGMTETITHIAVQKLNHFEKENHCELLPNIRISKDKRGCLVIEAPDISNEKIITNDCVKIHSENNFKCLGRYDNIINSGGIKIHPENLEKKIETILKKPFFISSLKDDLWGERIILIVESGEKNPITDSEKIKNYLQNVFKKNYFYPKAIYFLKAFSKTPTKKINRKETLKKIEF